MKLPHLDIHTQPAILRAHSEPTTVDTDMAESNINVQSVDPVVQIKTTDPIVQIDQSGFRRSVTGGDPLELNKRLYSQAPEIARAALAQNIEKWKHYANLHDGDDNPIATEAKRSLSQERPKLQVTTPPSINDIKFHAIVKQPEIRVTPGDVRIDVSVGQTHTEVKRGGSYAELVQKASVSIEARNLDFQI